MNQVIDEPKKLDLRLHCGARAVTREAVRLVPTPDSTPSWTPIPHIELIEQVESALKTNGLTIVEQAYALSKEGQRYFGMLQIRNGASNQDYGWVLGLRNTHDQSYSAGIVAGAGVFVCDNLSFSGEVSIFRKHTVFIKRDLPHVTNRAIGCLMERWHH